MLIKEWQGPFSFPMYVVDAFTTGNNDPYTGNPAAVVILRYDDEIPDETKRSIAASMKLSETAFVALDWSKPTAGHEAEEYSSKDSSTIKRTIRWFTPNHEVMLCGHATVASTRALVQYHQSASSANKELPFRNVEFKSKFSGQLRAAVEGTNDGIVQVTLKFPKHLTKPVDLSKEWVPDFSAALLGPNFPVALEAVEEIRYSPTLPNYMLIVLKSREAEAEEGKDNEAVLRSVLPDMEKLIPYGREGEYKPFILLVTIQGNRGGEEDFFARTFSPYIACDEDPACGSAHTIHAPYWSSKLRVPEGQVMKTRHCSERGGKFQVFWQDERVYITGNARVVIQGTISP